MHVSSTNFMFLSSFATSSVKTLAFAIEESSSCAWVMSVWISLKVSYFWSIVELIFVSYLSKSISSCWRIFFLFSIHCNFSSRLCRWQISSSSFALTLSSCAVILKRSSACISLLIFSYDEDIKISCLCLGEQFYQGVF